MKTSILFLFVGGLALSFNEFAPAQMVTPTRDGKFVATTMLQTLGPAGPYGPRLPGKFVTTTLTVLQSPPVWGKSEFGKTSAKGIVLAAKDWQAGRYFVDEFGRRWGLVTGSAYTEKPEAISGWLLQPENHGLNFFTVDGRLFRRLGNQGQAPAVLPEKVPAPKK